MPDNVEKIIRYRVVVSPPDVDAALKAQRQINERLRLDARSERPQPVGTHPAQPTARGTAAPAQAGGQPTPAGGQGMPPTPPPPPAARQPNWQWWRPQRARPSAQQVAQRQPVQPATGSVFADFFKKLQDSLRSNVGLVGPNSVFGQYIRGLGFGGTGPVGNFARYTAGNINFAQMARLIPIAQQGSPALAGAARGMMGQMIGGAALRGVGGAMLGAPGAALAGAGPVGLAVGAVLLAGKNIVTALKEAAQAVSHFTTALYSGDASQAIKGIISYGQSIVRLIGGPIIGAVLSKLVGVGNKFVDAMDNMVSRLGRWSPIIAMQQARYQVMQMLYERRLSQALEPLMNAWMQIKLTVLDGLARVAEAIMTAGRIIWHIVKAGVAFASFLLKVTGISAAFDLLRSGVGWLVQAFKNGALFILSAAKMAFDWIAKYDPSGAAKEMSKAVQELIDAITKKTPALSQSVDALVKSFFGLNRFKGLQTHGPGDLQPRQDARRLGVVPQNETPSQRIPGGVIQAVPPLNQSQGPGRRIIPPPTTQPIPAMAEGGIVRRPTVALIGERGPELVIPISHGLVWRQPHPDTAPGNANAFTLPNVLPKAQASAGGQSIRDKALLQAWASPYFSDPELSKFRNVKPEPSPGHGIYMRLPGQGWTRMDSGSRRSTVATSASMTTTHAGEIAGKPGGLPLPTGSPIRDFVNMQKWMMQQERSWLREKLGLDQPPPTPTPPTPAPLPPPPTPPKLPDAGKQLMPVTPTRAIEGGTLPKLSPPLPVPSVAESVPSLSVPPLPETPRAFKNAAPPEIRKVDPNQIDPTRQRHIGPDLRQNSPLPTPHIEQKPWWAHEREETRQGERNPNPRGPETRPTGALPAQRSPSEPMPAAPSQPTTRPSSKTENEKENQPQPPTKPVPPYQSKISVTEDRSGTKTQLGLPMDLDNNRHERLYKEIDRLRDADREQCVDDESAMLLTMMKGHLFARGM